MIYSDLFKTIRSLFNSINGLKGTELRRDNPLPCNAGLGVLPVRFFSVR